MADYREVIHERLYVKTPGSDALRKNAEGRLKRLTAEGWRELERWQRADHVEVKLERTGVVPMRARRPRPAPEQQRYERGRGGFGRGGFGGRGGGRGGGGRGGPRGGGRGGPARGAPRATAPSQQTPAAPTPASQPAAAPPSETPAGPAPGSAPATS
jgi:hypothetical protein